MQASEHGRSRAERDDEHCASPGAIQSRNRGRERRLKGEKEKEGKGREKDTEKRKEKKKKAPGTPPMYRHWKPIPNNGLGPADVGGSSLEKDPDEHLLSLLETIQTHLKSFASLPRYHPSPLSEDKHNSQCDPSCCICCFSSPISSFTPSQGTSTIPSEILPAASAASLPRYHPSPLSGDKHNSQ